MSARRSSLWTKTVAVGVIAVACVVGNVSISASEAQPGAALPAQPLLAVANVSSASVSSASAAPGLEAPTAALALAGSRLAAEALAGFSYSKFDAPVMGAERAALPSAPSDLPDVSPSSEDGQVVPAIYAWDPDVRFVFYRHVSKWM